MIKNPSFFQLTAYLCHCDADRRELVRILDEVFGQVRFVALKLSSPIVLKL